MIRLPIKAQCDQCDAECDAVLVATLGPPRQHAPIAANHAVRPHEVVLPPGWDARYDSRTATTRIHCPAHPRN